MSEDETTRKCVGCGKTAPPTELERFVYADGIGLVFDARRKAPGRGAWVCPTLECLQKALERGFARGFKQKASLPTLEEVSEGMANGIRQRLLEALRVSVRSGKAFVGSQAMDDGMRRDMVRLVLLAPDGSEGTQKKYRSNADRKRLVTFETFDGAFLGSAAGRDFVAVLGLGGQMAARVEADVRNLGRLGVFEG